MRQQEFLGAWSFSWVGSQAARTGTQTSAARFVALNFLAVLSVWAIFRVYLFPKYWLSELRPDLNQGGSLVLLAILLVVIGLYHKSTLHSRKRFGPRVSPLRGTEGGVTRTTFNPSLFVVSSIFVCWQVHMWSRGCS